MEQITKECRKCLAVQDIEEFQVNTKYKDNHSTWCNACNKQYRIDNNEKIKQQKRNRRKSAEYRAYECQKQIARFDADPRIAMLSCARRRAKKGGFPCTIQLEDIVIPDLCPLLEVPMVRRTAMYPPTLDKIIPELGYVPGNIMVISLKANWMKNNASLEELKTFSTNMLKLINSF